METGEICILIATAVGSVGTFIAAIVAVIQLPKITHQLKLGAVSVVLEIEGQMTARKQRVADFEREIQQIRANTESEEDQKKAIGILSGLRKTAIEDWLNALDRLCFCIRHDYIDELEWRKEYEDYITDVVRGYTGFFGTDTPYSHIVDLHNHWKRSLSKMKDK